MHAADKVTKFRRILHAVSWKTPAPLLSRLRKYKLALISMPRVRLFRLPDCHTANAKQRLYFVNLVAVGRYKLQSADAVL